MKIDLKNILNSGLSFSADEYELQNKYILSNGLLLALASNMLFFSILMYIFSVREFIVIALISAISALLVVYTLRVIQKKHFHLVAYFVFIIFFIMIFYSHTINPELFPGPTWFTTLILPAFFIVGIRFALILSTIYITVWILFVELVYETKKSGVIIVELTPIILTIWFIYFYVLVFKDTIHMIGKKNDALLHQSRRAAMGEMIEHIAHQWRQPLSQINSAILLLDGHLEKKDIQDKHIEAKLIEIESLTKYMSTTIDDFKNFLEHDKNIISFNLSQLMQDSLELTHLSSSDEPITFTLDIEPNIILMGYPNELQQVILILINNAKDSLIHDKISKSTIHISCYSTKEVIRIKIYDNAGGIDENIINNIFDPYFTTKQKSHGAGLGLYISKMIIEESMSGLLEAQNNKIGACFTITLKKG